VGKPNAGKSTFFSAATLMIVPIANYPFTTIKANKGISYLRTKCVCKDLGLTDNPRNSRCIDGERYIPVELIDCPGLVPGASTGKGLGNQFLDDLRKADALIHVVDASGSTDSEGKPTEAGEHDPLLDVAWLEKELEAWMLAILWKDWEKMARQASTMDDIQQAMAERLSGLGLKRFHIEEGIRKTGLSGKPATWTRENLAKLISVLRRSSKPMLLAANKIDLPSSRENLQKLRESGNMTIPVSAEAELALRRATEKHLISYKPGDPDFAVASADLKPQQKDALEMIRKQVLSVEGATGVQECINDAFFKLLNMIVVFPVEDPERKTDHSGNVLPDAILIQKGSTLKDLALRIHTDLGENLLYGVNARNGMRLGEGHVLNNGEIVSIVSASKRS
jgi:ribosome-binding ATPase